MEDVDIIFNIIDDYCNYDTIVIHRHCNSLKQNHVAQNQSTMIFLFTSLSHTLQYKHYI